MVRRACPNTMKGFVILLLKTSTEKDRIVYTPILPDNNAMTSPSMYRTKRTAFQKGYIRSELLAFVINHPCTVTSLV